MRQRNPLIVHDMKSGGEREQEIRGKRETARSVCCNYKQRLRVLQIFFLFHEI